MPAVPTEKEDDIEQGHLEFLFSEGGIAVMALRLRVTGKLPADLHVSLQWVAHLTNQDLRESPEQSSWTFSHAEKKAGRDFTPNVNPDLPP